MIEVKNIHKSFGEANILKGFSTQFISGKTNLIIGTSGSGKTVFLKCLLGLYTPDKGEILYDGICYETLDDDDRQDLRQKMGMVFQGSALFDSMTVAENVRFPLEMFTKQSKSEMNDRVAVVLKRVNLEGAENKLPSQISGGMQKRVAIARAVVTNPKYLFCDEPNSGLDPKTAIVIDNLIMDLTEEFDITTVINTHAATGAGCGLFETAEAGRRLAGVPNADPPIGDRDELVHPGSDTRKVAHEVQRRALGDQDRG